MSLTTGAVGASDRQPVMHATLEELDLDAVRDYVERRLPGALASGESLESLCLRLGLMARNGPHIVPSLSGLYLFGTLPQLIFPQWGIAAVHFDGTTLSDPVIARRDLEGNLGRLLAGALEFVETHSRASGEQLAPGSPGVREVAVEYPIVAVRELVLNALVHRELRSTGRVQLRLFDERMEIWSPGGPLSGQLELDVLAIEGGVSLPRNVVLAAHARALGLGEQLGRGLTVARRAIAEHSRGELEIETDQQGVLVTLPSGAGVAQDTWFV